MTSLTFDNEYQQHDEGQLEELFVQLVQKQYLQQSQINMLDLVILENFLKSDSLVMQDGHGSGRS